MMNDECGMMNSAFIVPILLRNVQCPMSVVHMNIMRSTIRKRTLDVGLWTLDFNV